MAGSYYVSCKERGLHGEFYIHDLPKGLSTLYFQDNRITSIHPETFNEGLRQSLKWINISNNALTAIDSRLFDGMTLKKLHLNGNDGLEEGGNCPENFEQSPGKSENGGAFFYTCQQRDNENLNRL